MSEHALSEGAQRILQIAAPLFAAKGFSGVSVNDISAAVGGSKANIFHHFANKRDLYLESIRSACRRFRSGQQDTVTKDGDPGERLHELGSGQLQRMLADPDSARLILREVFAGDRGIDRSLVAEIVHENFGLLVDQVRYEQDRGHLRPGIDPALVALLMSALNQFLFQSWPIARHFEEFKRFDSAADCSAAALEILVDSLVQP